MPRYKATYFSHELASETSVTQEFEGTPEQIAENYFRVYGDTLGLLETPEGEVVYDNMKAVDEEVEMWEGAW